MHAASPALFSAARWLERKAVPHVRATERAEPRYPPAPMLRVDALLLDMDGLLVDSEPLWHEVERAFARRRGAEWTAELAHACIGKGLASTLAAMTDRFGFATDVARDGAELVDAFIARAPELRLKTGSSELLAHADGKVPLALASSSSERLVQAVMERFALRDRFRAIVSGDAVARPKPAPDIFLEAARRVGVPAAACIVLEDSLAGVAAARAAGMRVVAVPERDVPAFTGLADHVVPDLHAAQKLLFGAQSAEIQ
jgi:sugar-phosphatase